MAEGRVSGAPRSAPTELGTPQGGLISPVLANLTLDGLEGELHKHFPTPNTGKSPLPVKGLDTCPVRAIAVEEV